MAKVSMEMKWVQNITGVRCVWSLGHTTPNFHHRHCTDSEKTEGIENKPYSYDKQRSTILPR